MEKTKQFVTKESTSTSRSALTKSLICYENCPDKILADESAPMICGNKKAKTNMKQ
jgi:hypothetical protein